MIFSLNGCVHCNELKDKLTKLSIPFNDIEITQNRSLWEGVVSQTGHDVLPTVFIQTDNEGNGLVYIPGEDFQDFDEIIKIIKQNF